MLKQQNREPTPIATMNKIDCHKKRRTSDICHPALKICDI